MNIKSGNYRIWQHKKFKKIVQVKICTYLISISESMSPNF